jgi:hypothetical protein
MGSDEQVVGDAVEVQCRQQFLEISEIRLLRLTDSRHGLSFKR